MNQFDRFIASASERDPDCCWVWPHALNYAGYGIARVRRPEGGRVYRRAHRAVYEALVGPIPDGLHLDHLCRVRACCNPNHLEPVTAAENTRRSDVAHGIRSAATHCPQGHPYDGDNVILTRKGRGRACRACMREHYRKNRERRKDRPPLWICTIEGCDRRGSGRGMCAMHYGRWYRANGGAA